MEGAWVPGSHFGKETPVHQNPALGFTGTSNKPLLDWSLLNVPVLAAGVSLTQKACLELPLLQALFFKEVNYFL